MARTKGSKNETVKPEVKKEVTKPEIKKEKLSKKEQIQKLLDYHNKKMSEAKNILMDDKVVPCYDKIVNTSGARMILSDFHALSINPESEKTFQLEPGERLNLLTRFNIKSINRNRLSLETAAGMPGMYGFPGITFVEDIDVIFPVELVRKTDYQKGIEEKEKYGEGTKIPLPKNEYDILLEQDIEKERKRNEKLMEQSRMTGGQDRKTRQEIEQDEIDKL